MSFEGYYQYIRKDYTEAHAELYNFDEQDECLYWRLVDQTNGVEWDDPQTYNAEVEEFDHLEIEHKDFKGNIYYTKIPLVKPKDERLWFYEGKELPVDSSTP